jgi:arylsulfatase
MGTIAMAGAASAFSHSLCFADTEESAKPDILLIMPDQMRGDCLSILEHPVVRTPNMDRLAKDGVLFRRAYTPVASCIPARYALLTGLHPQTSGVVGFRAKPFETPSLPELLAKAGYSTALIGRNMHQPSASGDLGYQKRILGSTYVNNDAYDAFLKKAAPESGGIRKVINRVGADCNLWPAHAWPLADSLHPTEWVVQQSRKVVKETDDEPLFLTTSFYAPHPPLFPPNKYYDAYMGRELPKPHHGTWVDWKSLSPKGAKGGTRILLEGQQLQETRSGYFGLIEHIDAQISPLIAEFKARSEKAGRPWVIVLTSDHGEMLGDHGYFRKCEPYEGSANIPFIFAASESLGFMKNKRIMQPVTLEDIMPTLLALAGTKSPAQVDGVNLLPTLRGEKQTIRDVLHFEHAYCYSFEQEFHAMTDGRYKYIWRPFTGNEQLFDLDSDPREETDMAEDKAHSAKLELWRARLIERLADRPEGFSRNGNLIPGCSYPALNKGTLNRD